MTALHVLKAFQVRHQPTQKAVRRHIARVRKQAAYDTNQNRKAVVRALKGL